MKYMSIIPVLFLIMSFSHRSFAHSPQGIELVFDSETSTLKVSVEHRVSKKAYHFVDNVSVELNDEEIITQKFSIQGSEDTQTACYVIPELQPGDRLDITASCNVSGKKTETLVVEESEELEE